MEKKKLQAIRAFTDYKINKNSSEEYYLRSKYFNDVVINAHNKGYRPIDYIEKDYFKELELGISMSFFKWYLLNYCEPCESFTAYDASPLDFYDIVKCGEKMRNANLERLKKLYKNRATKTKRDDDSTYYFAKIEYYKKPTDKYHVVTMRDYAVIFNGWAYLDPAGKYKRVKVFEEPKKYDNKILERYSKRPDEMDQNIAESIINKIAKSHPKLHPKK